MARPFLPEGLVKDKRLNVRLSEKEIKAVIDFANSQNLTVSTLIKIALKEYAKSLKNNEKTTRKGTFPDTF